MIVFLTTHAHRYTVRAVIEARPDVRVRSYDQVFASRTLPAATYIFTDMDRLGFWELELASELYRVLAKEACRVLNDPACVLQRYDLLDRLHAQGRNSFRVWRAGTEAPAAGYPVFLRTQSAHRGVLSGLLGSPADATSALQKAVLDGFPIRDLMFVEYRSEPFRPGMFLKQAAYRIGDRQVAGGPVIDRDWVAKDGVLGLTPDDVFESELARLLEDNGEPDLAPAFEAAAIDYGRADFGVVAGRVEVYEINTNPFMGLGTQHRHAAKRRSLEILRERYLSALDAITHGGPARRVPIASPRLAATRRDWRAHARATP